MKYLAEQTREEDGHYEFTFLNGSDQAIKINVTKKTNKIIITTCVPDIELDDKISKEDIERLLKNHPHLKANVNPEHNLKTITIEVINN